MSCGRKAAEAVWRPSEQAVRGIIADAQRKTGGLQGTSTACIAQLGPQSALHVANIGDSGLVVFRRRECIFASEVMPPDFLVAIVLLYLNEADRCTTSLVDKAFNYKPADMHLGCDQDF